MTMRSISILAASLVAFVPACTAEQAYNSAQGWQQQQCNKIPDKAEFDRCMSRAGTGYDAYKRQTEPDRK
jgi:hypothetical protein